MKRHPTYMRRVDVYGFLPPTIVPACGGTVTSLRGASRQH